MISWGRDIARLESQWMSLHPQPIPESIDDWERDARAMVAEVDELRRQGRWRTGSRTLMHALGIHHRETHLTAALAWILTPDGWHGLGERVLLGLLSELGCSDTSIAYPVSVVTEEFTPDLETRADVVVRFPGRTVLIEAKVFAGEQPDQCDRLSEGWGGDDPVLVFLTRAGHQPSSAPESVQKWKLLAWKRVADIVRTAVDEVPDCTPGVRELLATLDEYGGQPTHGTDGKVAFYLRHRDRIEEWAVLRVDASDAIETALLSVADSLDQTQRTETIDGPWRSIGLTIGGLPVELADTVVAVQWNRGLIAQARGVDTVMYLEVAPGR